jgi:hypothetical protein
MKTIESLAGTGNMYVKMQARIMQGLLHLQIEDSAANKPYGWSANFAVDDKTREWIDKQEKTLASLNNPNDEEKSYIPCRGRIINVGEDGVLALHLQIEGEQNNRGYGHAFNLPLGNLLFIGRMAEVTKTKIKKDNEKATDAEQKPVKETIKKSPKKAVKKGNGKVS